MREKKGEEKKTNPTRKIAPITPDAIETCLATPAAAAAFRNRGLYKETKYWQAIDMALALMEEKQKRLSAKKKEIAAVNAEKWMPKREKENLEHTPELTPSPKGPPVQADNHADRTIVLLRWAIKILSTTCEKTGGPVMAVMVIGVVKGSGDIAQSSFIKKRVNARCVQSKSTTYVLEGPFDPTYAPYPGFPAESTARFSKGFPSNWQAIVRAAGVSQSPEQDEHPKKKDPKKRKKRRAAY